MSQTHYFFSILTRNKIEAERERERDIGKKISKNGRNEEEIERTKRNSFISSECSYVQGSLENAFIYK